MSQSLRSRSLPVKNSFFTDEVILGAVLGAFIGLGFCEVMKCGLRRGFIDRESYVAQYIALVLLTIGIAGLLGTDDLLAAFAAGAYTPVLTSRMCQSMFRYCRCLGWAFQKPD